MWPISFVSDYYCHSFLCFDINLETFHQQFKETLSTYRNESQCGVVSCTIADKVCGVCIIVRG